MIADKPTLARAGLALILLGLPASAHEPIGQEARPAPVPLAEAVAHKPTALPDRVVLTFVGDPARSMGVTWRTDLGVDRAIAQIAPAEAGPKFVANAKTIEATGTKLVSDLSEAKYHSVTFDGLTPATPYAYRVGDGANWSEWFQFRTASDKADPFTFLYFGDAQNDVKSLWSRVVREAFADAPRAAFLLHAGDLINRANRDAEWGDWFAAGGWVNGMIPSVPSPGNHEYERASSETATRSTLSRHWRPQFTLPENGPEGLAETAYHVDYQGARIISLNSNEKQEEQVPWLESVLANNPNRWTILTFHHPIYSSARGRDNAKLRDLWQPLFDKYRVDLVLQGHDHTYARSGLRAFENTPIGVNHRDPNAGTVYVVSVSGPKMYQLDREEWMRRAAEDTQLYQVIRVEGDRLRFESRTAVGDLYDAFVLQKRPGQTNRLIERIPDEDERLRPKTPAAPAAAGDGGR